VLQPPTGSWSEDTWETGRRQWPVRSHRNGPVLALISTDPVVGRLWHEAERLGNRQKRAAICRQALTRVILDAWELPIAVQPGETFVSKKVGGIAAERNDMCLNYVEQWYPAGKCGRCGVRVGVPGELLSTGGRASGSPEKPVAVAAGLAVLSHPRTSVPPVQWARSLVLPVIALGLGYAIRTNRSVRLSQACCRPHR
jgi:hypothetical protein